MKTISLTVDILLLRSKRGKTELLLIERLNDPFKHCWALPGGFVDYGEDLEDAAKRELFEETSIQIHSLQQLKAYGTPGRDPRGHTVSVAFIGKTDETTVARAQDDAKSVKWFPLSDLPPLAFDHREIVSDAEMLVDK